MNPPRPTAFRYGLTAFLVVLFLTLLILDVRPAESGECKPIPRKVLYPVFLTAAGLDFWSTEKALRTPGAVETGLGMSQGSGGRLAVHAATTIVMAEGLRWTSGKCGMKGASVMVGGVYLGRQGWAIAGNLRIAR